MRGGTGMNLTRIDQNDVVTRRVVRCTPVAKGLNTSFYRANNVPFMGVRRKTVLGVGRVEQVET